MKIAHHYLISTDAIKRLKFDENTRLVIDWAGIFTYIPGVFPIFLPQPETKNEAFKKALSFQNYIYKSFVEMGKMPLKESSANDFDKENGEILEQYFNKTKDDFLNKKISEILDQTCECFENYRQAYREGYSKPLCILNTLSFLSLGCLFINGIYCGVKYNSVGYRKGEYSEEEENFYKEAYKAVHSEKFVKEYLFLLTELRKYPNYQDAFSFYSVVKQLLFLKSTKTHFDYFQSIEMGFELLDDLDKMGNRYAKRFFNRFSGCLKIEGA